MSCAYIPSGIEAPGLCSHFVLRIPFPLAAGHFQKLFYKLWLFACGGILVRSSMPSAFSSFFVYILTRASSARVEDGIKALPFPLRSPRGTSKNSKNEGQLCCCPFLPLLPLMQTSLQRTSRMQKRHRFCDALIF